MILVQAATKKAPKLSKEEAVRLRQERDPNFGNKGTAGPKAKRKTAPGQADGNESKRQRANDPSQQVNYAYRVRFVSS